MSLSHCKEKSFYADVSRLMSPLSELKMLKFSDKGLLLETSS